MTGLGVIRKALLRGEQSLPDQRLLAGVSTDGRATLRNTELAGSALRRAPDVMEALAYRSGSKSKLSIELAPGTTAERAREIEATAKAITAGEVTVKVRVARDPKLTELNRELEALPDVGRARVIAPRFEGEHFRPWVTIDVAPKGHLPDVKAQVKDWLSEFNASHPELPNVKLYKVEYGEVPFRRQVVLFAPRTEGTTTPPTV